MSYSLDNEVFRGLALYGGMTIVKLAAMAPLTAFYRITRGAFANAEDAKSHGADTPDKAKALMKSNDDVERVRRAHLNDLENIIPFILLALLYVGTNPDVGTALLHFKVFFFSRLLHTLVYVGKIRQPARGLCWVIGYGTMMSMAYRMIMAAWV